MTSARRLGLGSVQWGMPYGIANRHGQPDQDVVAALVHRAAVAGIDVIDTAHEYGEAETRLGRPDTVPAGIRLITKTAVAREANADRVAVAEAGFAASLQRLGRPAVAGLLMHDGDFLLAADGERLWAWMQQQRAAGRAEKIGVSVYQPEALDRILDRHALDIVQVPFSIYDQRFARHGLFDRLRAKGVEVHIRSSFLQGLLMLPPAELPAHFAALRPHQAKLHATCGALGLSPLAAALHFCLAEPRIDRVILGCETMAQLEQLLQAMAQPADVAALADFALNDESILLPMHWPARPAA